MFTKQKNVSKEQSLLEKSKKITNSFTTMISELRSLNTELSNLEAQKEEEITKLIETKNGLANQRVSNEKLADNLEVEYDSDEFWYQLEKIRERVNARYSVI